MNTPAHLIFGMTAFGRAGRPGITAAALAGSLLPDLSLYLLAGTHLFVLGTPPETVFGELYFSDAWQSVFRIDNSILLWGLALALFSMLRSPAGQAFAASGLLHLFLDFGFHHDDGRAHFWPVTDWIFQSPVSYWDPNHFGNIVGPIEIAAAFLCAILLWRRFTAPGWRALIAVLVLFELAPAIMFALMFGAA